MNFLRFYDILLTSKIKSQNGLKIPFSPYLPYIIVKISNMYVEFFYSKCQFRSNRSDLSLILAIVFGRRLV
jgi:hypothetical protein